MVSQPPRQGSPRKILHSQGLAPKKRFGQNFLINMGVASKMTAAAGLSRADTVLEVGPGLGAITRELSLAANQVVAVEKDRNLVEALRKEFSGYPNIKIVQGDMLIIPLGKSGLNLQKGYKVVANLPFAIASPLIRKFLEATPPAGGPPSLLVLLVQKEVAQRICAQPPRMNLLAVSVQFYAQPKFVGTIKKGSFWPPPKVDAGIIKIVPFEKKSGIDPASFFRVVKAGFLHPRKQLLNNVKEGLRLSKEQATHLLARSSISPTQRAETLSIPDWTRLASNFLSLAKDRVMYP
ncbi:MAG: ribosomal RNA small subunit methyltransferase A [Parcubacteria group bacterium]|nr:ribosomal RNA small subunit methyltransferase A [Parcubacteria group bacterium]